MGEPTVIAESLPYISRNQLVKLARPRFETVRDAASLLWTACERLSLPVQTYATATLYFQRFLLLNPDILENVQKSADDLREVACACMVTAFLTEGWAKKIEDAAAALDAPATRVIGLQRRVLETNAFDFRVQTVPNWVIKLAKHIELDKDTSYRAFLVAIDSCETTAIIQFPAHHIAAACIEFALRERGGAQGKSGIDAVPQWNMNKLGLKVVALRTATRLLLEFYDRCARNQLKTHASVQQSKPLQNWLAALQRSIPPLEQDVELPFLQDPQVSRDGTARYRAKQRQWR